MSVAFLWGGNPYRSCSRFDCFVMISKAKKVINYLIEKASGNKSVCYQSPLVLDENLVDLPALPALTCAGCMNDIVFVSII